MFRLPEKNGIRVNVIIKKGRPESNPHGRIVMKEPPSEKSMQRMRVYVQKYWEKSGTFPHPDKEVTEAVVLGLAGNIDEVGRPLCPCNFYPDKKAELDRSGRQRDVQNLDAERRVTEAIGGAELGSLRQQRDRAAGRVRALEEDVAKMDVRAPQDGILVYRTNWREEKKKVGDSVWFGEVVLALPDLTEMKGDAFVDEADGGPVRPGQPVTLRLEARPDFDLKGTVARIGHTVRQRSWRTPLKGFRVEIATGRTDPTFMRPAMRFRGEIETGRVPGLLLVPREAVFLRDDGPVVWKEGPLGWREAKVTLGRRSRSQVEVLSGLREGDRVSPSDLREEADAGPSAGKTS